MATTDTRNMTIIDLPLVRRLTGNGVILDSEMGLTRDARGQHSLLLSSLLFRRGIYTLVGRSEEKPVVGQFRYRSDDTVAHIVYLAPTLDETTPDTVWLHVLDAMAREAGKHGAHSLVAEVETNSRLFSTLRNAGYATYSRQIIWRHDPIHLEEDEVQIQLCEESDVSDHTGILSLVANIVPTILHQVAMPDSDMHGLVYRKDGRIEAYIGISEGKQGVYLLPYLHPDVSTEAGKIISAAIAQTSRAAKVPIYVCVRSYQNWLDHVMLDLDFEQWTEQAVMVKQIAAGIRHPGFERLPATGKLEIATPPYSIILMSEANNHEETE